MKKKITFTIDDDGVHTALCVRKVKRYPELRSSVLTPSKFFRPQIFLGKQNPDVTLELRVFVVYKSITIVIGYSHHD